MNDYIPREAANKLICETCDGCEGTFCAPCDGNPLKDIPAAEVVEVVRCRECKHRIVNEHYGEKGYLKLKAMCELDTGDPFELARDAGNDDWFCADGERADGGKDE